MGEKSPEGEGRQRGTVKWFNASKGFGFVTPEEGGEELFVHQTSIQSEGFRSLREGETVEFNVETGEDGRTKAVRVTGPGGSTPQGAPPRPRVRYPPPFMFPPHMMGGRGARGGRYPSGFWYYLPSPAGGYGSGFMPPMGRGGGGRGRNGGRGQPPREPSGLQRLKEAFSEWNVQRADVVFDEYGRSRGFGTIRFTTTEDAEACIEKMNNTDLDGRRITVRLDRYA